MVPVSKSSADQRKGRCGRIQNGICIRLYSEDDFEQRPVYTPPEILRSNLAEVILRMIDLKLGSVENFPFIDKPSSRHYYFFSFFTKLDGILSFSRYERYEGESKLF